MSERLSAPDSREPIGRLFESLRPDLLRFAHWLARDRSLAEDIVRWSLSRLAYYKAPGYVAFVPAVPLTSTQKIQRGGLKELVAASLGTSSCTDTRAMKKRVAA